MVDLNELFEPVIVAMGYELVGVEYVDGSENHLMRVYIDHENGITVDDCAKVSHQLSAVLEVEDPISNDYDLEVSSPGLERPLFKLADYERFAGQTAKIRMAIPQDGRKNYRGVLNGVTAEDKIDITVDKERFELPFSEIKKAHLVVEF